MELRNFFIKFSGDDYNVINNCSDKTQNRFALIGAFVFSIFILCFASSFYTFTQLFNNYFVGVPIAIFFSFTITNIYLLLLHTLTKKVLPHMKFKKSGIFTVIVRIIFISLIAVIVSKPLEVLFFSLPLQDEITVFKKEKLETYTSQTAEYFDKQIIEAKRELEQRINLQGNIQTVEIRKYYQSLQDKETEKMKLTEDMKILVRDSNYYIRSIIILNTKYSICWLITLFTVIIFLFPAYKKSQLSLDSNYYKVKKSIETNLVVEEYERFKQKYNSIFKENFGIDRDFNELYVDAPFNTIIKSDERNFIEENILISELYNG